MNSPDTKNEVQQDQRMSGLFKVKTATQELPKQSKRSAFKRGLERVWQSFALWIHGHSLKGLELEIDEPLVERFRVVSLVYGGIALLIAVAGLLSSLMGGSSPVSFLGGNLVLSLSLLCVAGALIASLYEDGKYKYLKPLRITLALSAIIIGGMEFDKATFNILSGLNDYLAGSFPDQSRWFVRCSINPGDSLSILLLGSSLAFLNAPLVRGRIFLSDIFGIGAGLTCLMSLIGWIFGVPYFCLGGVNCLRIAPGTPLLLTALATGILLSKSSRGLVSILTSANAGGVMARFWFPMAIGVPLLFGYLRTFGEHANLFDKDTGLTILVLLVISAFYVFIFLFARRVDQMDMVRKLTAVRLVESERRTRHIVESAIEAFVAIDLAGTIVSWNQEAQRLFGWTREQAIGQKLVSVVVPPRLRDEYGRLIADFLLNNVDELTRRLESYAIHADGHEFPVELAVFPVHWNDGFNVCAFIHDISDRKEAEARVSEFYSIVSHELRTPLTSIRGALGMINGGVAGELSPKAGKLVGIALSNCNRLVRLINDILDIRKIEAGQMELNIQDLDADALIRKVIDEMQGLTSTGKVKLLSDLAFYGFVKGDLDRITQVLTNLVSNAVKFSPLEGRVIIRTTKGARGYLRFSVIDEGEGIPANQLHRLFGKFQQLDSSSTRKKGGTGLGLAISKALIEQHGGKIGVSSVHTKGSTFWFELPLVSAKVTSSRIEARGLIVNKLILVAADVGLKETLESILIDKFHLEVVTTIEELNDSIDVSLPDIIIWDIMHAIDLVDRLMLRNETRRIPIIAICDQKPMNVEYEEDIGPRIVAWIEKPILAETFIPCIVSCLQKASHKILIVDDDPSTRAILRAELSAEGFECIEAIDGAEAISLSRTEQPDLIILDVALPRPNGFEVVSILRQERARSTPLITYSARELSNQDRETLTLGPTVHFTKAKTSREQVLGAVKELLMNDARQD